MVSLITVTSYCGNLVAALTTQHVHLPFKTLDEFAEDNKYSISLIKGSSVHTLFEVRYHSGPVCSFTALSGDDSDVRCPNVYFWDM